MDGKLQLSFLTQRLKKADTEDEEDDVYETTCLLPNDTTVETFLPATTEPSLYDITLDEGDPYKPIVVEDLRIRLNDPPRTLTAIAETVEPCVAIQPVTFQWVPPKTPEDAPVALSTPEANPTIQATVTDVQLSPLEAAPVTMAAVQVHEYIEPECSEPEADQRLPSPGNESICSDPPKQKYKKPKVKPKYDFRLSSDFGQQREAFKTDPKRLLELYQREWGKVDKFMVPLQRGPRHSKANVLVDGTSGASSNQDLSAATDDDDGGCAPSVASLVSPKQRSKSAVVAAGSGQQSSILAAAASSLLPPSPEVTDKHPTR